MTVTGHGGDEQLEAVFGADGHPDAATLAGLFVDAFDPTTTERLQAHLRDCGPCRADLTVLSGLPEQLSALPTPRMPDAVAERLSAAIAAEAAARQHGPPAAGTVTSLDTARERRSRRTRWMGLAAAGVAVLAAGGIALGVTQRGSDTGGHPSAEGGPSAGGQTVGPNNTQPGRNGGPNLRLPIYTRSDIAGKVSQIVADAPVGLPAPGGGSTAGPAGRLGTTTSRTACVSALGVAGTPLAVQHARFENQEAFVLVFRTDVARQVDVRVVGPQCGTGGAHQLYRATATY